MSPLPPPRTSGSYRIEMVCLGNICRSPIAAVVLDHKARDAGLGVEVTSSGTGDWHVGERMDRRAAQVLAAHGYDPDAHRARQFDPSSVHRLDLVLTMDAHNRSEVAARAREIGNRLMMFRDFDALAPGDNVPDPWYGELEDFEDVLAMVERTCDELITHLRLVDLEVAES